MKRILACIILFFAVANSIFADETVVNDVKWGYTINDGRATISYAVSVGSRWGCEGDITVPDELGGNPVVVIGSNAFSNYRLMTSVSLPETVIEIGKSAFSNCEALHQITLPFGLETIGNEAFYGCLSLLEIDMPSSVVSIGENAFEGCSGVRTISLKEGLLEIGDFAFYGCKSVKTITIPTTVRSMGWYVLSGCDALVSATLPSCALPIRDSLGNVAGRLESVHISEGSISIPSRAFAECVNLLSISIPDSVELIGYKAFVDTAWWKSLGDGIVIKDGCCLGVIGDCPATIELPDSVHLIASGAFSGCKNLCEISLPNRIPAIDSETFANCSSLTNVIIPASVKFIGNYAFSYCGSIVTVEISEGVTNIGKSAFCDCKLLKSIHIPGSVVSIDSEAFEFCDDLEKVIIDEGVQYIGEYAFWQLYNGKKSLREVILPDGLISIGKGAFDGSVNLKNITIPASVEVISDSAFYGSGLIDVLIQPGVQEVGDYAFARCNKLTSITIPASVQRIGDFAFSDCRNLSLLSLSEDLEDIGEGAFKGCSLLKDDMGFVIVNNILFDYVWDMWTDVPSELRVPDGVKSISAEAFNGCDRPRIITLPDSVSTIGRSAFRHCCLSSVTIPASVTKIRPEAFYSSFVDGDARVTIADLKKWCEITFDTNDSNPLYEAHRLFLGANEITALQIPAGVEEIKPYSFVGATNINSVIIPNGVTNIGDYAFAECNGVTSMSISDSVVSIGERAFYKSNALTSLTIPKGVNDVGYGAFAGCVGLTSVTIQNGVEGIGRYMFEGCVELSSVSMPDSLTHIADGAFGNCKGLTEINVPIGVTSIGTESFYGCSALTTITVHCNVTAIGSNAFSSCRLSTVCVDFGDAARVKRLFTSSGCSVTNVQFVEKGPSEDDRGPGSWTDPKTGLTWEYCDYYYFDWDEEAQDGGYVCDGGITIIKVSPNPAGVLQIPASINCRTVRSVDQPWCYGNMEYYDWGYDDEEFLNYCDELTAVNFPDTIKEIGPDMVRYCPNLTSVYLPEGLISIGKYSFMDCGLTSIEYPSTLESDLSYIWKSPIVTASIRGGNNDYFLFEDGGMYTTGDDYRDGFIWTDAVRHGKLKGCCREIQVLSVREGCVQLCSSSSMGSTIQNVFLPKSLKVAGSTFSQNPHLVSVCFSGRPIELEGTFYNDCPNVVTYVPRNMGWEDIVGRGVWQGRPIYFLEDYKPSQDAGAFLPVLPENATTDEIRGAFLRAVDQALKKNIRDIRTYNSFREWASDVGCEKVQSSAFAWMSYALNQGDLLSEMLKVEDLKVEGFKPVPNDARFEFIVGVNDIAIGPEALSANLKTVFGVEGSTTLGANSFSEDAVDIESVKSGDGKLRFTAGPKEQDSEAFFMKMKIKE